MVTHQIIVTLFFKYKNQSWELYCNFPSSCITLSKVMNIFFEINNNNFHLFLLNFIPEPCTFNYSLSKINIGLIGINSSLSYVLIRLYLGILRPLGDSIFRWGNSAFNILEYIFLHFKIECSKLCKNTRACLDPQLKLRLDCFYSNLSKCGTRVNKVQ